MEAFLKHLAESVARSKAGLEAELNQTKGPDINKTGFVKSRSVMIRQLMAKDEEGAKKRNLSTKEGVDFTKEEMLKWEKIERWLIL